VSRFSLASTISQYEGRAQHSLSIRRLLPAGGELLQRRQITPPSNDSLRAALLWSAVAFAMLTITTIMRITGESIAITMPPITFRPRSSDSAASAALAARRAAGAAIISPPFHSEQILLILVKIQAIGILLLQQHLGFV